MSLLDKHNEKPKSVAEDTDIIAELRRSVGLPSPSSKTTDKSRIKEPEEPKIDDLKKIFGKTERKKDSSPDFKKAVKKRVEKLSPVDEVYRQIEDSRLFENVVGFFPATNSVSVAPHICNIAIELGARGYKVCIVDMKLHFPNIYLLLGEKPLPEGTGISKMFRFDTADIRDNIIVSKHRNVYILGSSPDEPIEKYFDTTRQEISRVLQEAKGKFDIVLVDIPLTPQSYHTTQAIKECDKGFICWGERIEAPQNTKKLLEFFTSISHGMAKFNKVLMCDTVGSRFPTEVIKELDMGYIGDFPLSKQLVDSTLEGRPYIENAVFKSKKYKNTLAIVCNNIIGKGLV